jgi:hypothetical protein
MSDFEAAVWVSLKKVMPNVVVGYHGALKVLVGTNNPNLVKFIVCIKEEADKIDMKAKLLSQDQALERIRNGITTLRCN